MCLSRLWLFVYLLCLGFCLDLGLLWFVFVFVVFVFVLGCLVMFRWFVIFGLVFCVFARFWLGWLWWVILVCVDLPLFIWCLVVFGLWFVWLIYGRFCLLIALVCCLILGLMFVLGCLFRFVV